MAVLKQSGLHALAPGQALSSSEAEYANILTLCLEALKNNPRPDRPICEAERVRLALGLVTASPLELRIRRAAHHSGLLLTELAESLCVYTESTLSVEIVPSTLHVTVSFILPDDEIREGVQESIEVRAALESDDEEQLTTILSCLAVRADVLIAQKKRGMEIDPRLMRSVCGCSVDLGPGFKAWAQAVVVQERVRVALHVQPVLAVSREMARRLLEGDVAGARAAPLGLGAKRPACVVRVGSSQSGRSLLSVRVGAEDEGAIELGRLEVALEEAWDAPAALLADCARALRLVDSCFTGGSSGIGSRLQMLHEGAPAREIELRGASLAQVHVFVDGVRVMSILPTGGVEAEDAELARACGRVLTETGLLLPAVHLVLAVDELRRSSKKRVKI